MKPKATHTTFYKGKKIRIVLRTGEVIIDKFVERKAQFLVFENHKFESRELKNCSLYKAKD